MAPTLGQQHTAHLRIGSFAKLIAAATKGLLIDFYIGDIEQRPIYGHEPIASKEGLRGLLPPRYRLATYSHECLHHLAA